MTDEKQKICVVVASRANYGRIKSVLRAIEDHPQLELQLVVSASALLERFGKVINIIEKDGFEVDARVYIVIEGETPTTMAKSTGLAIVELSTIFENLRPDIVLTVADRYETIATAIAASYMNIPLAHTQGGEVTGSIDESVRHAVTKLAHIHFPATELSRQRLIKMGENPDTIFCTGCPSLDIIHNLDLSIEEDFFDKYAGVGDRIDFSKPYLVILQHPVTTEYSEGREQIFETLLAVQEFGMQVACLWPNADAGSEDVSKGIRVFRENVRPKDFHFFKNFAPEDYARFIYNSKCLIGNSSSGIRECALLGIPVVNIGTRQQGRERAKNVMDAGYSKEDIKRAVRKQVDNGLYEPDYLYGDGQAGGKIADILSYCEISIQKKLAY
ncbi:MAG: UDP-N-acetylglucosamine 2-epimerase (hydrolyzing) [Deltaproteobacteria bacterium]|nr:UDP-N-acetylglucosamine 2-epimerase (hydrolyzing) [Deltaproteobacteria bacterium]